MPQVTHLYPPASADQEHVDIRKDDVEEAGLLAFLRTVVEGGAIYIVVDRNWPHADTPMEASND